MVGSDFYVFGLIKNSIHEEGRFLLVAIYAIWFFYRGLRLIFVYNLLMIAIV